MPEQEFELYLDLLARLLRMSPRQKEAIAHELRDHLEARFEELVRAGTPRDKAIRQALEEFGDTAGLAHQFTQLSRKQMRRWIMRGTLATAAVGAVILLVVNAFLPERGGPAPQPVAAQDAPESQAVADSDAAVPEWTVEYIDPVQFVPPDLAQPLDIVLDETPLREVMEKIDAAISLPVVLDVANLQDAGVTPETPISDPFPEDPLYLRLDRALDNVDGIPLGWLVEDDVLVVTTKEITDERLLTISYGVGDLLARGYGAGKLIETIQTVTNGPWLDLDGIGGTMEAFGEMLIVRQTQPVHLEVATTLRSLRGSASEQIIAPAIHARLEAALGQTVSVDFVDLPLDEAIDELRDEVTDRIRIDAANLHDAGVELDTPITIRMADRPLRTVLEFMLGNVNGVRLRAITSDGMLVITTAEIASEMLGTVVYDVSDVVDGDADRSAAFAELLQYQTTGPWFDVDGMGGVISVPAPGVFIVRQSDRAQRQVRSLIKQQRDAILAARASGAHLDVFASRRESVETRNYQMDAETAEDLLTLLPEMVASGTWASTIGPDGQPITLADDGIGVIRIVAAGRKVVSLSGAEVKTDSQSEDAAGNGATVKPPEDSSPANADHEILIIPQAVLIIRHKPSVHREIREFLQNVAIGTGRTGVNESLIPALDRSNLWGGGVRGGGFY